MSEYCESESVNCYCQSAGIPLSFTGSEKSGGHPVVIFGSRGFENVGGSLQEQAERVVEVFESRGCVLPTTIISGGADGADAVAEAVALQLGVPMVVYSVGGCSDGTSFRRGLAEQPWLVETVTTFSGPEDDPTSGRGAYLTRNCMMADCVASHGGAAWAIWDGNSPGTRHMLDSCRSHGIDDITVWEYDQ